MLLQQNSVAHYRARLYECLSVQPGISFEFVADPEADTPYLATATATSSFPFTPCPVWRLRLPGVPEIYFQPGALARLLFGQFDVAIALGSPYSLTTWAMLLIGPMVGTRILLWTHGLLEAESGPKWWLRRLLYRSSAGLLLYGERARQLLLAQGSKGERMFVVKNSLDPEAQARAEAALDAEALAALRERLDLRAGDRTLIFIGRLQPVKRLDLLVRAAGAFLARGQRVHVVLLGEGQERETLERLSVEQGVRELVHFEGAKYREAEIAAYFAASDLCVIPSGAGLTVLHALGYGTPVLTHDRPELQFPEVEAILPGETGAFYTEGDMDSLLLALEEALFPQPMKLRVSETCRRRVALDYGPTAQASRMAEAVRWAARL